MVDITLKHPWIISNAAQSSLELSKVLSVTSGWRGLPQVSRTFKKSYQSQAAEEDYHKSLELSKVLSVTNSWRGLPQIHHHHDGVTKFEDRLGEESGQEESGQRVDSSRMRKWRRLVYNCNCKIHFCTRRTKFEKGQWNRLRMCVCVWGGGVCGRVCVWGGGCRCGGIIM